jgi:NAD(P)-dependent dehydrogenase (short-subunit alcohol dehydrogenase family)
MGSTLVDRLDGRVVFLTGGGGVLGSASAELFAREGARVAVVDAHVDTAEKTASAVREVGGEAIALQCDVRVESEVRDAVEATVERWGKLDGLFTNAGIMPHGDESVLDMDTAMWDLVYDVNVKGTALCCKYAVPHIIAAGGGSVVTMSSFLALVGCSNPQEAYGATRGAVISFTRSLAVQLGPRGVRVNALCPGPIETPHVRGFFPTEEARQLRLARVPMARFGRPADVAEPALFLLSDASAWITGQIIVIDGGISINYF